MDGDIIHVPAIKDRIEIKGSVLRPGFYELLADDGNDDIEGDIESGSNTTTKEQTQEQKIGKDQ